MLVGAINASAGKGYRSIVLPLIGVGVYGLPLDKVCAAYYEALMEVKHLNISVYVVTREAKEQRALQASRVCTEICAFCPM